jgi:hypothetical protein
MSCAGQSRKRVYGLSSRVYNLNCKKRVLLGLSNMNFSVLNFQVDQKGQKVIPHLHTFQNRVRGQIEFMMHSATLTTCGEAVLKIVQHDGSPFL